MKGQELKYFKRLNRLATVAVYLTTILLTYLLLSSFISGAVSGSDTQKVMGLLLTFFGQDETKISAKIEKGENDYFYDGDEAKITVTIPQKKAYTLTYESSDESIATVSSTGTVKFISMGNASVTVTATAKEGDATFDCTVNVSSKGKNPLGGKGDLSLKTDSPKVGEKSGFLVNDGKTVAGVAKYTSLDESKVKIIDNEAYFIKDGTATIRGTFEDGSYKDFVITVAKNSEAIYLEDISFSKTTTYLSGEKVSVNDFITAYIPSNALKKLTVTSSDENIVAVSNGNLVMKDRGEAIITFTSVFDENFVRKAVITVEKITPTSAKITAADTVMLNSTIKLTVEHSPVSYPDDATWTVVSGFGKIVDGNNLKAEFFGKIKVRYESKLNPELSGEKVISVKLYDDFYSFVRKILGHFSLFALLGLGIWGSCFLLTNPPYSAVIAPGLCFILAALCEMFQAFTPGRYFTIGDVFVNFFGTLTGMLIGIILVVIFCVIFRLVSKESFEKLKNAYSWITVKTVFFKNKKRPQNAEATESGESEEEK